MTEVYYRFKCYACGLAKETKDKSRIPTHCPSCGYSRDRAGHVYRQEPPDGAELDA